MHGLGEGGRQERQLAEKYRSWARQRSPYYPFVGGILEGIADAYEIAKTILEHAPFATEVVDENDIDDFVASIELPSGTAWCLIWLADIRPIISPTS